MLAVFTLCSCGTTGGIAGEDVYGDGGTACEVGKSIGEIRSRQDDSKESAARIDQGIRETSEIVGSGEEIDGEFRGILSEIREGNGGTDGGKAKP
ncbi:MAG: hypothetical protein IJ717_00945 [Treponema sp.]|nr:hypothetical protein [Treponema sp.]